MVTHGTLRDFDSTKESIEDFRERFEFYCLANNIKGEGEALRRKKALFVTLLGQATFAKLKDLANPNEINDLSLDDIMGLLIGHYRPKTIEIAERFKFFKRTQGEEECTADFIAELRRLAKTCNFGQYLDTAIRDQFVCGLRDKKCQQELLAIPELTVHIAQQRAAAAEVVSRETVGMQEATPGTTTSSDVHKLGTSAKCHRCGKAGHQPSACRYKGAKCHLCQKVGHLARACRTKKRDTSKKPQQKKTGGIRSIEEQDDSSSDSSEHLHAILQLGTRTNKFLVVVKINGIPVEMEVDSGAERSTVPLSVFNQKLAGACKLKPSNIELHQYDKSLLIVAGECRAQITINQRVFQATFVVVDVQKQLPLLGRDWMMKQATQIHHTSESTLMAGLMSELADVFRDELGVLKGIEANVSVEESAVPRFHKARSLPFALREKVEQQLWKQVNEGELIPVDKSDWATPIVVVRKKDGGIRICGDFKVSINPVIKAQVYALPTPEEMFSALANGESYTKLDLARAYKQMKVQKECQPLLTINTHQGLYQYARLPFGIMTAPSLWQKAMAQVLNGLSGVACYIDDILITGRTREEHVKNL